MFRRSLERWRLLQRVMGIAIAETNVPAVAGMRLLKVREHKAGSRRMKSLTMLDGHLAHPTGMYWFDTLPATDLTDIKMTAPVRPDIMTTGKSIYTIRKTYRACVLTLRNAPEWPLLKERLDLNLQDLVDTTYADIFPRRAFLAQCNAPRLGSILKR